MTMALADTPYSSSPFVRRIREVLREHEPFGGTLRVSVADEPQWEDSSSGGQVLVRWACWNLEKNGEDITKPVFDVLSHEVTAERLAHDLPILFPDIKVVVDNCIEI